MSGPDFHDLVGDEGAPEERDRLRRVHDLLVAAGPPPELSPRIAEAPGLGTHHSWLSRRRGAAFALAAGVAAAAFGVGWLVGDRGSSEFAARGSPVPMHAVAESSDAKASIEIGQRDAVGNWPLLVHVSGLQPLPKGEWYELYLTRDGKPAAYCGAFSVTEGARTTVELSIPWSLKNFDGWIVATNRPKGATNVLLTT